jgi:broad specificity phosphatase PhoE
LKRLFFMRHGETEWNATARMQGQSDSPLSALGVEQSEANARLLATLDIEALFSSPLNRARRSAEIVSRHLRLPVRYDERIKEWNCGDWTGYLYDEVKVKWVDEWAAFEADHFHYRGPNCENYPDMIERSAPFVEELLSDPARNIAIVSHGIIGRVMVSMLLGLDARGTLSFRQPNDVLYRVTLDGDGRTVDHYRAGEGPIAGVVPRG